MTWNGMYVGTKHLTDVGLSYFDYDLAENPPPVELRLPDGTFVSPSRFRLSHAMSRLERGTVARPPTYNMPMQDETDYFREGKHVGRCTRYLFADQKNSIIISFSYGGGSKLVGYFEQNSGKLLRIKISATGVGEASPPAIRSPKTGEVLTFPLKASDLKRIYGEPTLGT